MERVKCRDCAMIANTASPNYALCECGGRLRRAKLRTHIRRRVTFSLYQRIKWQPTEK